MANMHYCMFENTNRDFAACVERLGDVGALSELNLSEVEAVALESLVRHANTLVSLYEGLQAMSNDHAAACAATAE